MIQEDLGFVRMAASTGGMATDATGALEVEVDASSLGAIVGMSLIAGIIIGSTWIRRRTVNTYVGVSRTSPMEGMSR